MKDKKNKKVKRKQITFRDFLGKVVAVLWKVIIILFSIAIIGSMLALPILIIFG